MFSTDYANICPRSLSSEQKEVIGVKRYEMDVKYHGILLGKKGVTVKALEKASGATIRFETSPQGALIIMGTDNQRQVAWKLITSVQATLPKILSQIRDQNIRLTTHSSPIPARLALLFTSSSILVHAYAYPPPTTPLLGPRVHASAARA